MSDENLNSGLPAKPSLTDWEWLEQAEDKEIDFSDIPPLGEGFFSRAQKREPRKKTTITINIDADVLDWFKSQRGEYEERMNAALRMYAEAHRPIGG